MSHDTPLLYKALAFFGVIGVQCATGITYRISQAEGKYEYDPAAAICLAELFKLTLSVLFHVQLSGSVKVAWVAAKSQISMTFLFCTLILGAIYALNNQIAFFNYQLADPGTISLFKAGTTFISAMILRVFLNRRIVGLQWAAIILQISGLIIVQYNPDSGMLLPNSTYVLLFLATALSAIASVGNEYTMKNFKPSINVQNSCLYSLGFVLNLIIYVSRGNSITKIFHGFDRASAILVIVLNACMGLVITALYKYTDAIVKTFATTVATVFLVLISFSFFSSPMNLTIGCGVIVVLTAAYIYVQQTVVMAQTKSLELPITVDPNISKS